MNGVPLSIWHRAEAYKKRPQGLESLGSLRVGSGQLGMNIWGFDANIKINASCPCQLDGDHESQKFWPCKFVQRDLLCNDATHKWPKRQVMNVGPRKLRPSRLNALRRELP